ncbi:WGxxGxxG family protein [Cohnella sp. GCM10027633]|uniref:WGxxGxxG family protein n=1 Tax=unclassified Cohnella TaxID=2636738 RepID=UPI0036422D05
MLLSSLLVGSLSVAAVAPTFASVPTDMTIKQMTTGHGLAANGMTNNNVNNGNGVDLNPFDNNGNGTRLGNDARRLGNDVRSGLDRTFGTNGTGTYSPNGAVTNNGYGTYDRTRMNAYRGMSTTSNGVRTNNYRAAAATDNDDGFDWGWLGLLGLLGLAGMRGRSRDGVR